MNVIVLGIRGSFLIGWSTSINLNEVRLLFVRISGVFQIGSDILKIMFGGDVISLAQDSILLSRTDGKCWGQLCTDTMDLLAKNRSTTITLWEILCCSEAIQDLSSFLNKIQSNTTQIDTHSGPHNSILYINESYRFGHQYSWVGQTVIHKFFSFGQNVPCISLFVGQFYECCDRPIS